MCAPFTLADVFEFCTTAPLEEFDLVRQSVALNTAISDEGLTGDYGLRVGKVIREDVEQGVLADDATNYAMMLSGAAADARMAGVDLPVMSNSGSGNQGIASTMPVVGVWRRLDGRDEERLIRACALSSLITIYIKSKFGVLSALCGAVVAGTAWPARWCGCTAAGSARSPAPSPTCWATWPGCCATGPRPPAR